MPNNKSGSRPSTPLPASADSLNRKKSFLLAAKLLPNSSVPDAGSLETLARMLEELKERGLLDKPIFGSDTALTMACKAADKQLIAKILALGADPDAPTAYKQSPLMQIIHGFHHGSALPAALECMEILHEAGADIHHKNEVGQQAIHWAGWETKSLEPARWLLSKGAKPSPAGEDKETPLHTAAKHGNLGAATLFIEAGADLFCKTRPGPDHDNGLDPLGLAIHWAKIHGNLAVVALIAGSQLATLEKAALQKTLRKKPATPKAPRASL